MSAADKVQQITEQLPDKIRELFASDKYAEYLNVLGKFSNYSFNNTLLIAMQRPDATYVAGYKAWENKFDRHVVAGSKGIQILQPAPYKREVEEEMKDEHGNTIYGYDGKPLLHKEEVIMQGFKVGYVFAYEDTEGSELPSIVQLLDSDVKNYEQTMDILKTISPAPIVFHEIKDGANGYYSHTDNGIHVKEDLLELQMIKTTIHEMAHAILHNKDNGTDKDTNRREKEVEAESVAYTVCNYLGLDTSDYSFGYIAGWSADKELKELKETMEKIRETSNTIISKFNDELLNRKMSQEQELAFKYPEGYFYIQEATEGFDYSYFDRDFNLLDGGIYEDVNGKNQIGAVARELLNDIKVDISNAQLYDTESLLIKTQEVAISKLVEAKEKIAEKQNNTVKFRR